MDSRQRRNEENLPDWLLTLLVCPVEHGKLKRNGDALECTACGRRYPIRDGIPIMIVETTESER